jgi:hypothetical protein
MGVLQASKSLKIQVLLDVCEMQALFAHLGEFYIAIVSEPVSIEQAFVSKQEFLENYRVYVTALQRGELPEESSLRRYFSGALTRTTDALYAFRVGEERYLIKPIQPLIQMQVHHFFYSTVDGKFHPLVLGKESVTWGIQFSYPQIAQDPQSGEIRKVDQSFLNTSLFTDLSRWMRNATRPTPFLVGDRRSNEPIRLGKDCFSWIGKHPQLQAKGIAIRGADAD